MPAIRPGPRFSPSFMLVIAIMAGVVACGGEATRQERYLQKAEALVAAKDYDKAQLELRNALQIDPTYLPALLLMGEVAGRLGEPSRAVQMYQAALEQDEANPVASAGLARLYLYGGLPDEALELVERGLAKSPQDATLLTVRGAIRARLGDDAGAVADAERALAQSPAHESAVALLASLYAREDRIDEAVAVLVDATRALPGAVDLRLILASLYVESGRAEDAEHTLRAVVELEPDRFPHRAGLARFLVARDRVPEAEQVLRAAVASDPKSLEAKSALVGLLASHGSFESAERQLLAFVRQAPKDLDLRQLLGDFYAGKGMADEAADVYREIVRSDEHGPTGLASRNRLAALALAGKRMEVAEALVAEVLEANPQDNDALVLRADMALARGDAATAIADLRAVLRDQPMSVPVQRALAQAYLQSNDVALALEALGKAIETSPGDPQLRVDLARVLVRSGEQDRALKVLQDAVAQAPEDLAAREQLCRLQIAQADRTGARLTADKVKAARPDLPLGHYLAGLVSEAEGSRDAAMESYEAALKVQPDAPEPLTALVGLLVAEGRATDAIARLERVSREQPRNAIPRNLLGELLASRRRFPEALAAFDEATALAPAWWIPYRGKGLAQVGAGDAQSAVQTMQRGFDASGGAIALGTELASLLERLGRPDDAIATYERMLGSSPSHEVLVNNLAMLLATHRSDTRSLERARQLSERFKDSDVPAYLNTAGWASYRLGRYDEAVPLLERASDQLPDAPMLRYHLALAQIGAGQVDDARRNLEAVLESGMRFPGVDDARVTLEQLKGS